MRPKTTMHVSKARADMATVREATRLSVPTPIVHGSAAAFCGAPRLCASLCRTLTAHFLAACIRRPSGRRLYRRSVFTMAGQPTSLGLLPLSLLLSRFGYSTAPRPAAAGRGAASFGGDRLARSDRPDCAGVVWVGGGAPFRTSWAASFAPCSGRPCLSNNIRY